MIDFTSLQSTLLSLDHHFKVEAGKSVNRLLTMRNWLFGFYIVEFQQNGADRAAYGEQVLEKLAKTLKTKGFSFRNLKLYRQFYLGYPQFAQLIADYLSMNPIGQTVVAQLQTVDNQMIDILQPVIAKSSVTIGQTPSAQFSPPAEKMLNKLSFLHISLLLTCANPLQRALYEIESIRGGWSVRELKRQIESLLFERTGKNEAAVRYALGGLDEQLFVSQYKLLLPDEEVLQAFLRRERGLLTEV
ncbi:MAG: hypothetical protein IPN76_26695 [Saprospiraceae bacterium]|nr:hypothetical protein [Saprospiraceae bacterium]